MGSASSRKEARERKSTVFHKWAARAHTSHNSFRKEGRHNLSKLAAAAYCRPPSDPSHLGIRVGGVQEVVSSLLLPHHLPVLPAIRPQERAYGTCRTCRPSCSCRRHMRSPPARSLLASPPASASASSASDPDPLLLLASPNGPRTQAAWSAWSAGCSRNTTSACKAQKRRVGPMTRAAWSAGGPPKTRAAWSAKRKRDELLQ